MPPTDVSRDADESASGGYVHDPESGASGTADEEPAGDFGTRGWLLVAIVVFATIVVPGFIYLYSAGVNEVGVPFLVAMLALPMVPALLLGLTAVWSMTAATSGSADDAEEA